eukprot:m.248720 g.248720  ORF g.248720 m.248720 type:complete len:393 (-) comp15824_c0_seq1:152-1330(-)
MLWILSILCASTTWSVSEIFSDMCIDDSEEDDAHENKRHNGKLSGEQATFLSGATMLICAITLNCLVPEGTWAPDNLGWWIAFASGFINALAALMLYKAYETAPSTVIVPLVQLTAVMMLLTSTIVTMLAPVFPALLESEKDSYLTPRDAIAYVIILIGGLYPAAKGNIQYFLRPEFWKQPYVMFILINDLMLAFLYEMIEIATSETHGVTPEQYIIVSSYTTVLSYCFIFSCMRSMRREVVELRHAHRKYIQLCVASEVLNWAAYWIATYAYQVHQANVNIVNTAEVALNQVMNLVTALVMKFLLSMGRDEAVTDLPAKILSCICVTGGIILSSTGATNEARTPKGVAPGPTAGTLATLCADRSQIDKLGMAAYRKMIRLCDNVKRRARLR